MEIKVSDIRFRIALGILFFIIALVDSILLGATSYCMLSWWGKTAFLLFMVNFVWLLFDLVIKPSYLKIKKMLTKK